MFSLDQFTYNKQDNNYYYFTIATGTIITSTQPGHTYINHSSITDVILNAETEFFQMTCGSM
jgi:hypothetical protein